MDSLEEQRRKMTIQKDLLKLGLAKTSDEALDKASEVMQGRIFSDKDVAKEHHPVAGITEVDDLRLENKKLHQAIVQMNEDMKKVLEMFRDKMSQLENEIGELKNSVYSRQVHQSSPILEDGRDNVSQNNSMTAETDDPDRRQSDRRVEQARMAEPKSDSEKRQRTGAYKPGDVDVNKMFYYGNK